MSKRQQPKVFCCVQVAPSFVSYVVCFNLFVPFYVELFWHLSMQEKNSVLEFDPLYWSYM